MSAEAPELTLNGRNISELRVVDLKRELDERGLPKGGSKRELLERLRAVSVFSSPCIHPAISVVANQALDANVDSP